METHTQNQDLPSKKTEHDIEIRSMALAFRLRGDSYRKIGGLLGISHSTVQSIILKFEETGSIKNKTRSGRPQKLKAEDIEILKHDVLENRESRTMSLTGISQKFNEKLITKVCESTVRKALKEQGITCHAAARKPFINEINRAKRVAWCQERINWTVKDWKKVCILLYICFIIALILSKLIFSY